MKRSLKTTAVVLAIVMSFVAVHAALAAETVTGTITDLNTAEQWVEIDSSTVIYCIPFNFLAKQDIYPTISNEVTVTIEYFVRICPDGSTKNCAVTYDDITLPGARGKKK